MEPEVHYPQGTTTGPYPEPNGPVHTFPSYFSKIHSNITFPSMPRSSEWSLPFRFTNQYIVFILSLPCAECLTPLILLDLITLITFSEAYKL